MKNRVGGYYDIEIDIEKSLLEGGIVSELFYLKDLKQRKLFLTDDVEQATIGEIVKNILQYNREDYGMAIEDRKPILLYVASNGGEVDSGFELIDVILSSKTPVYTINLGSMTGDILFQGKLASTQGTIIFNGNGLAGNLSVAETVDASANGVVNINFQNGSIMTGYIRGHGVGYDGLKRVITFDGGANKAVLDGNVFSYGTSLQTSVLLNKSAGNHITFNQGNMKGSIIATVGNGLNSKKGYNNITFNSGGLQTLIGGILAQDDNNQGNDIQATNTLTISKSTTLQIIAGDDNQIQQTAEGRLLVHQADVQLL